LNGGANQCGRELEEVFNRDNENETGAIFVITNGVMTWNQGNCN
jgi:hypothetical protein